MSPWPGEERRQLPDPQAMMVAIESINRELAHIHKAVEGVPEANIRLAVIEERIESHSQERSETRQCLTEIKARLSEMERSGAVNDQRTEETYSWMKNMAFAIVGAIITVVVAKLTGITI